MSPIQKKMCSRIARNKGDQHKRAKLWQAMRILREFTCEDVAGVCEQGVRSIRQYVCLLSLAGYVHIQNPDNKPHRYRLVRNSGPKVPHVVKRHTAIYDPNTDQEYSLERL